MADEPLGRKPWRRDDAHAGVRRAQWRGEDVTLVKPLTFMNVCGPVIARSLRRLGAEADSLILVYDDLDLPLGAVRVRVKGSAGGHNGVRSVIEALGTTDIRRVKVGVGPARSTRRRCPTTCCAASSPTSCRRSRRPCVEASDRVLNLVVTPIARS